MIKTILYILMRNDLPSMNVGKAIAQASHASAQFINNYRKTFEGEPYTSYWLNEGKGFGTTVVLEGSKDSIKKIVSNVKNKSYCHYNGAVIDTTYPFKAQKELLDIGNFEKYNIQIVDDTIDKFGMITCTRVEHTCSYLFVAVTDEEQEEFKKLCEEYNIYLHR